MKKVLLNIICLCTIFNVYAQDYYWVFFTDKNGVDFNPYEYFDEKAIERRINNQISLYDITDFPLNEDYKYAVENLSIEIIGESRWFNALAVSATNNNIEIIRLYPFVKSVIPIDSYAKLCSDINFSGDKDEIIESLSVLPQLKRMEGEAFIDNNIDGTGIRIAVFDGGFPKVDTHEAFKHLFENNKIIATYNFPKKRENVYGWNKHGTMVLSCIAGINQKGQKIGLATGSEFLLAITEINIEPKKEEVWWMMAMEWADKNGANIINSSLGYGIDRHYTYYMDGKTTLVTKAANLAASKGILVCNAMGNEALKSSWKTLIAPADADSILSVGGIDPATNRRISFSSYGPTADGRIKPNVCAYGNAFVAKPKDYGTASGTSFSSPLVAGFAACAWQTKPEFTAMQLKKEIEKSGDNYPYFDYAFGYGVPQADYFMNNEKRFYEKSFEISEDDKYIIITPVRNDKYEVVNLYYHIKNNNGILDLYEHLEFWIGSSDDIKIHKTSLIPDKILMIYCNGYTEEYVLNDEDELRMSENITDESIKTAVIDGHNKHLSRQPAKDKPSKFGVNSKYYIQPYIARTSFSPPLQGDYDFNYLRSKTMFYGIRYFRNISKCYKLGINADYSVSKYHIDKLFGEYDKDDYLKYREFIGQKAVSAEFFQRIRFIPGTTTGFGIFVDIGIYGSWVFNTDYNLKYKTNDKAKRKTMMENNEEFYNWGLRAGIGYGMISVYGQYRINDMETENNYLLPKLEIGLEISIPLD